jgi:sodium transport system permease protein
MVARGVNPGVATPVRVEDVDVSTERSRAALALSVLPVFLLVSAFVMGMGLATDTTAGERERRTLESLLLTGARPWAIGAGKWVAAATLNVAGFALTLAVAGAILARLPLEDLGVRLDSVLDMAAAALAVGVPLAMLAAAMQLLAAARARSFKEGQTYLSMLLFVPMVVGMVLAFSRWEGASWQLGVPVLAQHQLLSAVLRGDAPGVLAFAAPALIALAVTALLLRRVAKLVSSPQILYGG